MDNCLWANRVMESGKHRISLKLIKGEGNYLYQHLFGLVRDGAAWDKCHADGESTDAWYMGSNGKLYGNGKQNDDGAGSINEGQIVSMEADLDKGTLRFWVDGWQAAQSWLQQRSSRSVALGCEFDLRRCSC